MLPAESGLTGSEHAALLRLRGAVRDALAAHTDGREDPEAAARLTRALAEGRLVVTVDAASMVQLASAARASYPGVVAAIAVAIAEAATAGAWPYGSSPAPVRRAARRALRRLGADRAQGCDTHVGGGGLTIIRGGKSLLPASISRHSPRIRRFRQV